MGDGEAAAGAVAAVALVLAAERAAAEARVRSLARQVEGLAEQQALDTHDDEHDPEGVTIAVERAQLQGLLAGARRDLAALDRAAERLRAGTYGSCLRCGDALPPARLEALPATEICIRCASGTLGRQVAPKCRSRGVRHSL